ncbi:MAG: hypothetical protein JNL01_07135 [Bdellovibrionales bacterium]|nr:hypothetical protein [Bdellovibrionales bacterium]
MDLQTKVSLILTAVVVPTFVIVLSVQNQFASPILKDELKQLGISTGRSLARLIVSRRWLQSPDAGKLIESAVQEIASTQPNIIRIDVIIRDSVTNEIKIMGSNFENDSTNTTRTLGPYSDQIQAEIVTDDDDDESWDIYVPIEQRFRDVKLQRKFYGVVHIVVSLKFISRLIDAFERVAAGAAAFSVVSLILLLSYFLRRTLENDRRLREAETQNIQLSEQLHEAERQLMNSEKLAVMGQLTASFAHEIGTPLNAVGGHLQLLKEESGIDSERIQIIGDQLNKIEGIVRNFLQSTAKPSSQRQLVDVNKIVDRTLGIVRPRIEAIGVDIRKELDREMGPIRAVPVEIEQILLNLVNNSLDSMKSKKAKKDRSRALLEVSTSMRQEGGRDWAFVEIYDTGEGIGKADLENVLKPFFSTKGPREGTGLGLTICQELARKYGGDLEIDSKEGVWTRVTLKVPYQTRLS